MYPKSPNGENIFVFSVLQKSLGCHVRKHVNLNRVKAKSFLKVEQK